jgi:hypothetical protein
MDANVNPEKPQHQNCKRDVQLSRIHGAALTLTSPDLGQHSLRCGAAVHAASALQQRATAVTAVNKALAIKRCCATSTLRFQREAVQIARTLGFLLCHNIVVCELPPPWAASEMCSRDSSAWKCLKSAVNGRRAIGSPVCARPNRKPETEWQAESAAAICEALP